MPSMTVLVRATATATDASRATHPAHLPYTRARCGGCGGCTIGFVHIRATGNRHYLSLRVVGRSGHR
jgi:hypothetical protein